MDTDIKVGWGPVTWTGVVTAVVTGLLSVATFLTTLANELPAELSTKYGVYLTLGGLVVSALATAITAAARVAFAKQKAVIESARAYALPVAAGPPSGEEVLWDDPEQYVDDPPLEPTDYDPERDQ